MLLAGGQGSRLGHPGPKGTFVFGPEPSRSLYRILAERVLAGSRRAGQAIPLIVLTSPDTTAITRAAFEEADHFGLAPTQVRFVEQGTLPCVDEAGQALLAGPGELALAPDGHGGALTALERTGTLAWLLEQGVDALTTFQVDNPLARPLDPVMLGWMIERRAQVVTKAVAKSSPDERVGVYARDMAGRHRIVEYSELPEEGAADLTLGSIAVHALQVRWLHDLLAGDYELPLHPARKQIPVWSPAGIVSEAGIKLERFLFDVFPEAPRLEVHEVRREWEFAPVKNATGVDSADSARLLVDAELRRWYAALDRPVPEVPSLHPLELDGAEPWQHMGA
jgi:UDP-N-acetylglucosamine/UDP-N-acetylgalactosamine diphosphorylase